MSRKEITKEKEVIKEDVFKNNYLDIKLDPIFKAVFSTESPESKEALKGIIEAYTDQKVINVQVKQNEITVTNQEEKQIRIDVYCTFNNGKKAMIEMAFTMRLDELVRSEYYTAKTYSSQDTKGVKDYRNINPVYNITLIDKGYRFKEDKYSVHEFEYYDPKRKISLDGKTRIIIVELDKIELIKDVKSMDSKERWGAFLKWINDESKRKKIEEIINLERGIKMATKALGIISKNENMVWAAIEAQKKRDDWRTQLNLTKEEGARNKAVEIAKNALKKGLDAETISAITGLSIAEIQDLK